jgi:DNA-binding beta-propeller fold protein YncE
MRALSLLMVFACSLVTAAQGVNPLVLSRTIPLPAVSGKFDHFAVDTAGHRLFAAATGNHSVEVIDLNSNKVAQSITGLGKPHGLIWVEATGSLYIADGALGELRVYRGTPLALAGTIKLSDDADDMVYDAADHLLFAGHGGSDAANPALIAVVKTDGFALAANLPVATHPEALEIDPKSGRVFANIAEASEVAVIGASAMAVATTWKLTRAGDNVPLAFDPENGMMYIACRKPGMLLSLDATSGKEIASVASAGQADDLFYDAALHRLYLISGAGEVDSYQIDSTAAPRPLPVLRTVPGAKTALFVPEQSLLYVGVPGTEGRPAEIRVYKTNIQ